MSTPSSGCLGFLGLPPEIRLIIYGVLFSDSKIELRRRYTSKSTTSRVLRSTSLTKDHEKLPRLRTYSSSSNFELMYTCRTVRDEATAIFFHHMTLVLSTQEVNNRFVPPSDFYFFQSPDLTATFREILFGQLRQLDIHAAKIDTKVVSRLPLLQTLKIQPWAYTEPSIESWTTLERAEMSLQELHTTEAMAAQVPAIKNAFLETEDDDLAWPHALAVKKLLDMPDRKFSVLMCICVHIWCKGSHNFGGSYTIGSFLMMVRSKRILFKL